jgi:4-amino-4-deoxy-L-arabinose transferase-like glycosyltransferase
MEIAIAAAITALAAFLRAYSVGAPSLWLDEALSVDIAHLSWSTLWVSAYDVIPPLYYSLVKLALFLGESEAIIRLPGVIAGTLTIPVMYGIGRLTFGPKAGIAAALVLAVSNVHVDFSQDARMYGVLVLGLSLATLGALGVARVQATAVRPRLRANRRFLLSLLAYGVGVLIALYTHNIAVFYVAILQIYAVWIWYRQHGRAWGFLIAWVLANGALLLLWLPWLFAVFKFLTGPSPFDWLEHATFGDAFQTWRAVLGYRYFVSYGPVGDVIAGVTIAYGIYKARSDPGLVALLLLIVIVGPVAVWLTGFVQPIFMLRTIIWVLIGGSVAIGIAAATSHRLLGGAAVVALVALGLISTAAYYERAERQAWRDASGFVARSAAEGDAVVICAAFSQAPFLYYQRDAGERFQVYGWQAQDPHLLGHRRGPEPMSGLSLPMEPIAPTALADISSAQLWVIDSFCKNQFASLDATLDQTGWALAKRTEFRGIEIYAYARIDEDESPDQQ